VCVWCLCVCVWCVCVMCVCSVCVGVCGVCGCGVCVTIAVHRGVTFVDLVKSLTKTPYINT